MTVSKTANDRQSLVGFVTVRPGSEVTPEELREFVSARLPRHLVPSRVEVIEAMPTLPNGKLDRKSLRHRQLSERSTDSIDVTADLSAEDQELLANICSIFEQVLGQSVGPSDDFFALGGHSIIAVRLFGQLSERFGIELPISTLFEDPTPLGILESAREVTASGAQRLRANVLVPIRKEGTLPPLFIVHGAGGNILKFGKLAGYLAEGRPVYGLQAKNVDGVSDPHETIEEMAAEYLDAIDTVYPHGVVHLAGYSGGGVVAIEIGRTLHRRGRLGSTILIDTFCPSLVTDSADDSSTRRARKLTRLKNEGMSFVTEWIGNRIRYERLRLKRLRYNRMKESSDPIPHALREIGLMTEFRDAVVKYTLQPIDFPVVLLASETGRVLHGEWNRWTRDRFTVHRLSGDHYNILNDPMVRTVAGLLDAALVEV
ncbi:MAG: alpha/beta fold hydrolase [Rhodothermales bacterium]|nr:alpha/beta fold hydrolase [Rhodothermales bacterium]